MTLPPRGRDTGIFPGLPALTLVEVSETCEQHGAKCYTTTATLAAIREFAAAANWSPEDLTRL